MGHDSGIVLSEGHSSVALSTAWIKQVYEITDGGFIFVFRKTEETKYVR
jgi:hypothetical protein